MALLLLLVMKTKDGALKSAEVTYKHNFYCTTGHGFINHS